MRNDLLARWRPRSRTETDEWDAVDQLIERTDPAGSDGGLSVAHLGGLVEGTGRLNLSTLHSAKGREFDAVILFAMNSDVIPGSRDERNPDALREARRLFYVGATRGRK